MWFLRRLMILILLLPALAWGQSVDQRRIGLYMATQAGTDCSQATLAAADAAALANGQILVIPPNDRLRVACQWVVSSALTIQSPVFFPYSPTPVLKVNAGITLTLDACPVVWSDYFIIDANDDTTGTVEYTAGCTECFTSGPNSWTSCTTAGGGAAGFATEAQLEAIIGDVDIFTDNDGNLDDDDLTDDLLANLLNVDTDVDASDDQVMVGDGSKFRGVTMASCNATTQKIHFDGSAFSCETDASGPGAAGDITAVFNCLTDDCSSISLADGDFLDMSSVDPDTTTEGLRLPQGSDCSLAIAMGQTCVDTDDGSLWIGNDSAAVKVSTSQTWQDVVTNNPEISTATVATPLKIGEGGDDYFNIYIDASDIPTIEAICDGGGCDRRETISTDKVYEMYDEEGAAVMETVDPDAGSPNAMRQYGAGYEPLVSTNIVLTPFGNCTVAYELIASGGTLDEWMTCVDTVGDGFAFSYIATTKISTDTTNKITVYAVNKNTASTGTLSLVCADQATRPNIDVIAGHSTTGEQTINLVFTDPNASCTASATPFFCCTGSGTGTCQSRLTTGSATFTLNGTLGAGALIKGKCNVSAAPGQIADIRIFGTAVLEVFANSRSD